MTLWCNLHLQNHKRFFVLIKDNLHIQSEAKAADQFYYGSHYHYGLYSDIISFTLSEWETRTYNGQIYKIFGFRSIIFNINIWVWSFVLVVSPQF